MLEKRRYFRIHFDRQVHVKFDTQVFDNCQVKNISLGGMFILGDFPFDADDQCSITIVQESKTSYMKFKALAQVVRCDGEGVALKFMSMPFESLVMLELILLYEPDGSSAKEKDLPTDLPFHICEEESIVLQEDNSLEVEDK